MPNKISIVRISIKDQPDTILSEKEWNEIGKMKGFCATNKILIKNITGIENCFMPVEEFEKLKNGKQI
jgi:hypothetical protein